MSFTKTLTSFCDEMSGTFPELGLQIARTRQTSASKFWRAWKEHLEILLTREADKLFSVRRGILLAPLMLTEAMWCEVSDATRAAIWKYLRTLTLEAAMDVQLDSLDAGTTQLLMDILTQERLEAGGKEAEAAASELFEESISHLKPLLDRLKNVTGSFLDLSGLKDLPLPEIPERLRNGRIAKLAEQLAKQFNPAEFGIDPAVLEGDNVEDILKRLAELYQRDPTLLIAGAKRVAERIKKQILGGSLNREELIAEAEEFIKLFKEHPLFKEGISKLQGILGEGGIAEMFGAAGSGGGAPSERRRAVQERLRKKMEARRTAGAPAPK
jgi:hypothetical protein